MKATIEIKEASFTNQEGKVINYEKVVLTTPNGLEYTIKPDKTKPSQMALYMKLYTEILRKDNDNL